MIERRNLFYLKAKSTSSFFFFPPHYFLFFFYSLKRVFAGTRVNLETSTDFRWNKRSIYRDWTVFKTNY